MNTYRLFVMDAGSHIHTPPVVIEAADDDDAVRQAEDIMVGCPREVWHGARCLASFCRQSTVFADEP